MTLEAKTPLNNQEWLKTRHEQQSITAAAEMFFNAMRNDEVDEFERITNDIIDGYLSDADASWTEAMEKDELVEMFHQLWPHMQNYIRCIPQIFKAECEPYYRKVAERLAQDRIKQGET